MKPTGGTYVALLEACRRTRDSKAAVEVFEAMETDGVRPGVQSYTSLLQVQPSLAQACVAAILLAECGKVEPWPPFAAPFVAWVPPAGTCCVLVPSLTRFVANELSPQLLVTYRS